MFGGSRNQPAAQAPGSGGFVAFGGAGNRLGGTGN